MNLQKYLEKIEKNSFTFYKLQVTVELIVSN